MSEYSSEVVPEKLLSPRDKDARRHRLRVFQAQLVDRMQVARSGVDSRINQLGIMIGPTRWLLNLKEAGEIVSVGTITNVPLTQNWFLGLTNIRGNLISVVDFSQFQGGAAASIDKDSRIIAFSPSLSFNSGLLVSRVMGLRNVADMDKQPVDETDQTCWFSQRFIDHDAQEWRTLDLSLVVQDPQFLHVGL
jgi:twitching motility protein PilI